MSIYVTGDFHGSMDIKKISSKNWSEGRKLTSDDFLIQLGDFGLIWDKIGCKKDKQHNHWRNWLGEKSYTFCFVDGNHEGYTELEQFPIEHKFGGKVRVIPTDNKPLYQLLRGEVYNFNGHKCIALGGAESQDKQWRIPDVSWWKQENWNHAETEYIIDQIQANPNIEYVFAHTCPDSISYEILRHVGATSAGTYKEYYEGKCECQVARAMQVLVDEFDLKPKEWHFGHWHLDCFVTEKDGVKYQCHYNHKPTKVI